MWQATFEREVANRWAELCEALGIDDEGDAVVGTSETVRVWWELWEEVGRRVGELGIVNPAVRLSRPSSRTAVQHDPGRRTRAPRTRSAGAAA